MSQVNLSTQSLTRAHSRHECTHIQDRRQHDEKRSPWEIVHIKDVAGIQFLDNGTGEFALEMRDHRSLLWFRCPPPQSVHPWVKALKRATALTASTVEKRLGARSDAEEIARYQFTMLQEDLKNAGCASEWCHVLHDFTCNEESKACLKLHPVEASVQFVDGYFVEHVKDVCRSPHWKFRIVKGGDKPQQIRASPRVGEHVKDHDESYSSFLSCVDSFEKEEDETYATYTIAESLQLDDDDVDDDENKMNNVRVGKPPQQSSGPDARRYYARLVRALVRAMRKTNLDCAPYTYDELAKWILRVKRIDRSGDLVLAFISSLSGGFSQRRFVKTEGSCDVSVTIDRTNALVICECADQRYTLMDVTSTYHEDDDGQENGSTGFGTVTFDTTLRVTLDIATQNEKTELLLIVKDSSLSVDKGNDERAFFADGRSSNSSDDGKVARGKALHTKSLPSALLASLISPKRRRRKSNVVHLHLSYDSFCPSRGQISLLYQSTFGDKLFTPDEITMLSEMSVFESFSADGARIVTQGSVLNDLYILTVGEADVVRISAADRMFARRRKIVHKEGWLLKKRKGWYQRSRRRYVKIVSGEILYARVDPKSPKFNPSKDWSSQPIVARNVVKIDDNEITVEDSCDPRMNMTLKASSAKEAQSWRGAIEAAIHAQVLSYSNAVRVSRLYPGDIVGRPLNIVGDAMKAEVSVFTRAPVLHGGLISNAYQRSIRRLRFASEHNTRGPGEGPPATWKGLDVASRTTRKSDGKKTSGPNVVPYAFRVQCLRLSRESLIKYVDKIGKREKLDRFFHHVASRRISCSRASIRWLALNKAQETGFHVVWLSTSSFRSGGVEFDVKSSRSRNSLSSRSFSRPSSVDAASTKEETGPTADDTASADTRVRNSQAINRGRRQMYEVRFLKSNISIRRPKRTSSLHLASMDDAKELVIPYSDIVAVGGLSKGSQSFPIDTKVRRDGVHVQTKRRRLLFESSSHDAMLGLRQVLTAHLAASGLGSFRRRSASRHRPSTRIRKVTTA